MLFNVERDTGGEIVGYLVPDNMHGQLSLAVTHGDKELLRMPAGDLRESLVIAGRHETGLCGFTIDEARLPGLAKMKDLEIRDVETGLVFYRRCNLKAVVPRRIFRLETHLLPLIRLDRALRHRFQFHFPSIDRYGMETSYQMFLMNDAFSIYLSGRVSYRSVEFYLDQGYDSIVLLQDPFEELAERLLVLRQIGQGSGNFLGMRDNLSFEAALAFATDLPLESDRELNRAFRTLEPVVINVLSDPLVRQLTTRLPDEQLTMSSISSALNILSGFGVVGVRSRPDLFAEALVDYLSLATDEVPVLPQIPVAKELGARLRACRPVERLLEHDLAVYHFVADAFEKSLIEA